MPYLLDLRTNIFERHKGIEKSEGKLLARLEIDFDTVEATRKAIDYQTRNAWKCQMLQRNGWRYIDKHHFGEGASRHFEGTLEVFLIASRLWLEISTPPGKKFSVHFQPFRGAWKRAPKP